MPMIVANTARILVLLAIAAAALAATLPAASAGTWTCDIEDPVRCLVCLLVPCPGA